VIELTLLEPSADVAAVQESAALLSVAADPVRWGILQRLLHEGTKCVCDLQPVDPVSANVLSYHLKVLREAGLVTTAKRGRWVDYTLAGDALERLHDALPGSGSAVAGGCATCR
jgi:ArsR family transcriptional regulator, arsenate/arsenite/antimonite-responsive transcriptional repressor